MTFDGECDCGNVKITIPALPDKINACPCDYCTRVGAHWGYYPRGTATVAGLTQPYRRSSRTIEFHRCTECGVLTHWIDPGCRVPHMGVHMKNFDQAILADVQIVVDP